MDKRDIYDEGDTVSTTHGLNYYLKQKWKLCVTLFCLFSFITMGIHLEISGSTMLPLSIQVGTNLAQLSWIVAARGFGYMITIIIFGIIFRSIIKNHSELMLAIGYIFPAAATVATPYLKSLWTLCIALLFQGMLHGVSDLAVNTLITTMWTTHSTAPLNCVYFGYCVGSLLSIIIVRSFRQNNSLIENKIENFNSTLSTKQKHFQPELVGPYTIASIFCLISSIGFGFIAYKQNQYRKQRKLREVYKLKSVEKEMNIGLESKKSYNKSKIWKVCSPTTCGQGYLVYGFILIFLLSLYNSFFGGIEQGFTKFFISFIEKEQINIEKKDTVYTMIFFWLPMLFGRILCIFLTALWISPRLMLFISLLLCLLTYLLWIIFIWYIGLTRLIVFILVTLNGLSISSISPTTIGWIKQFLSLSPIELTIILISNAIGGIVFSLLCGHVIQYYGSKHLFTILIILILLCFISFILVCILRHIHSKRENNLQDKAFETFL